MRANSDTVIILVAAIYTRELRALGSFDRYSAKQKNGKIEGKTHLSDNRDLLGNLYQSHQITLPTVP